MPKTMHFGKYEKSQMRRSFMTRNFSKSRLQKSMSPQLRLWFIAVIMVALAFVQFMFSSKHKLIPPAGNVLVE